LKGPRRKKTQEPIEPKEGSKSDKDKESPSDTSPVGTAEHSLNSNLSNLSNSNTDTDIDLQKIYEDEIRKKFREQIETQKKWELERFNSHN